MSEAINVRFRYTEASYADGVRRHLAKRFRWQLDVPVAGAMVVLGAVLVATGMASARPLASRTRYPSDTEQLPGPTPGN
jgi:hypothetical protein